jgi:cystathionine beta-lyase/cystathionine gamma-synthase
LPNASPSEALHFESSAIHAGQRPDSVLGAVMPPIVLSTTFAQLSPGRPRPFEYSRCGNPTRAALETCIATLEAGRFGFAYSSGCAATNNVLELLGPDEELLCCDDVYGGTYRLFQHIERQRRVTCSFIDYNDLDRLQKAITPKTKMVWVESPTNPLLKLYDLSKIAQVCKAHGLLMVVDNTFASPALQRPLESGADVVLHSTTKYLNGHSDVIGGAVVTRDEQLAQRIAFLQNALGSVPSPMDCYLVLRGIKTLPLRMREHCRLALELARRLQSAPGVKRVIYPGLPSHPQHELALRQMPLGGGGIISFEIEGGEKAAHALLMNLQLFTLAESLGGIESLAEHPATMTHATVPRERRLAVGITDGLIRLSIGIENIEDLWADLSQALSSRPRQVQVLPHSGPSS